MYPYIKDKSAWPLEPDIMYWNEWLVCHPALIFAGYGYEDQKLIKLWENLKKWPESKEGNRNFPIRQPLIWF